MSTGPAPARSAVRLALAPRWWAWHGLLVVAVVAMGWLGLWQLRAFEDRGSSTGPAPSGVVDIDQVTAAGGRLGPEDPGRVVTARGTWEADRQVTVPGRALDGRRGAWVVTPLRTASGVLPVVRGWVPAGDRPPGAPVGPVTVRGVVQPSETGGDAPGGAVPREGQIGYVATVTLLAALPYDATELYDGYVVLRSTEPADPAAPRTVAAAAEGQAGQGGVGAWRNLAYALQWWLFAAAAVFFWAAVLRRAVREQRAPRAPSTPSPDGALSAPRRTT